MKIIKYETKEELITEYEKALEEFGKPKWSIKMIDNGYIVLYNDKNFECKLVEDKACWKRYFVKDFSELIFVIVNAMGYFATPEQMLDNNKTTYGVRFDLNMLSFVCSSSMYEINTAKIIDTPEHALYIVELLNDSPAIKEWLEFCRGGE